MIESWRRHSTSVRPQASLGYRPPAPEVFVPAFAAWPAALTRPAPPARLPRVQRLTVHYHEAACLFRSAAGFTHDLGQR